MAIDEPVDLGFSADQLRSLLGSDPLTFAVTYEDDSLGYLTETVTFSDTRDLVATRVSRAGADCAELHGEPFAEVLHLAWTTDVSTASGDVVGTATVGIEAYALDLEATRYEDGEAGPDLAFSAGVWDAFFEEFPNREGSDCDARFAWSGPVPSAVWSLGAYCESSETLSLGSWLSGTMVVAP